MPQIAKKIKECSFEQRRLAKGWRGQTLGVFFALKGDLSGSLAWRIGQREGEIGEHFI